MLSFGALERSNNPYIKSIRNLKLLFKKDFKSAELQLNHPFSFASEPVLEMAKEKSKSDVEVICARVTKYTSKKAAKTKVNLNRSSRSQIFFK